MWMRRTSKEKENNQSEKEIDRKTRQLLNALVHYDIKNMWICCFLQLQIY